MPRNSKSEGHVDRSSHVAERRRLPSHAPRSSPIDTLNVPKGTTIDARIQEKNRKAPGTLEVAIEVAKETNQTSGSLNLKTMIDRNITEIKRDRRQVKLDQSPPGVEGEPVYTPASRVIGAQQSLNLFLDDQVASDIADDDYVDKSPDDLPDNAPTKDSEHNIGENALEQAGQHEDPMTEPNHQSDQTATTHTSMTPQEKRWWAMSFEELYQHAKNKRFGKGKTKDGRKSGRVYIIKWLCKNAGISPYVAPSVMPTVEATPIIMPPPVRPNGAISHPEAILRTSNPALQRLINESEQNYRQWSPAALLEEAMRRSYQLLKDSKGKLPSKSISAMANWLAAWDVLKSPREKRWWLGDGIDLANKAKAMGYQGSTKKYDVILWLRSTPEESDAVVAEVAKPTPNKNPLKRKAEDIVVKSISKRPAKGSKRPHGWDPKRFL